MSSSTTPNSDTPEIEQTPEQRFREYAEQVAATARERVQWCESMARVCYRRGIYATPEMVNNHARHFQNWYAGILPTGHMFGRTGAHWLSDHKS